MKFSALEKYSNIFLQYCNLHDTIIDTVVLTTVTRFSPNVSHITFEAVHVLFVLVFIEAMYNLLFPALCPNHSYFGEGSPLE